VAVQRGVRILGLDVGTKTIGVALSDELGISAHPLTTILRQGNAADAVTVSALVVEHEVTKVVVGLPLELSGAEGRAVRRVRAFTGELRTQIASAIDIREWDERFSSVAVERAMIEADVSRRRRRQLADQQAAVFILQGWLDSVRDPQ
jgi:putative Holliday junction resolvase